MNIKIRTVSTLSLATLAHLNGIIAHAAVAQPQDLQPPPHLAENSNDEQFRLEQKNLVQDLVNQLQNSSKFLDDYGYRV